MLSWFDAKDFQRFGDELAVLFMEDKPGAAEGNRKQRRTLKGAGNDKGKDTVQAAVRKLVIRISAFEPRKKANIYKKAQFANAFKWRLQEAGYDAGLADEIAKELLLHFR